MNPPEKKSQKFCGALAARSRATRLWAGFFGSTALVFSALSAVAIGVSAGAIAAAATGAAVGAAAGVIAGIVAGPCAAATAGAALGATISVIAGIAAGAAAGDVAAVAAGTAFAAGAAFAAGVAFGAGAAGIAAVDAGDLEATGGSGTGLARAANAAAEYGSTGSGGGWFLAREGSTSERKPTAQTTYTPRQAPTVNRTDGRR